ncbi:MAG TPA: hypothetical protein VFJ19_02935 [Nocardioidaceae bacterium]|nr:hypothetical protein [Nocardioidaceae bacterium]
MMLGIHLYLAPDHLEEKLYIGVLFLIGSALLGFVMVALASDQNRLRTPGWLLGGLISVVMFVAFVVSRTSGLPLGYHETWASSSEDLLGLASLFLEVVFVACMALSVKVAGGRRALPHLPAGDPNAPLP